MVWVRLRQVQVTGSGVRSEDDDEGAGSGVAGGQVFTAGGCRGLIQDDEGGSVPVSFQYS